MTRRYASPVLILLSNIFLSVSMLARLSKRLLFQRMDLLGPFNTRALTILCGMEIFLRSLTGREKNRVDTKLGKDRIDTTYNYGEL